MIFKSSDAMAKAFESFPSDEEGKIDKKPSKEALQEDEGYEKYWEMAEVEDRIYKLKKEIRSIELSLDPKGIPEDSKVLSIEEKEGKIEEHEKILKDLEEEGFKKGSDVFRFWLRPWFEMRNIDHESVLDDIKKGFHYGDLFNSLLEAERAGFVKVLSREQTKDIKEKLKELDNKSKDDNNFKTEKIRIERNLLFLGGRCFTRIDFNPLYFIESQKPPKVKKEKNEGEKKEIERRKIIFKELKELRRRANDERKDFQFQNRKFINNRNDFLSFWRNQNDKDSKIVSWFEGDAKVVEAVVKFRKNNKGDLMVDWNQKKGKTTTFPYENPPSHISRIIEKKLRKGVIERGGFLVDNKFPRKGSLVVNEKGRIDLASIIKFEGIYFPRDKKEEKRFINKMPELGEAFVFWKRKKRGKGSK